MDSKPTIAASEKASGAESCRHNVGSDASASPPIASTGLVGGDI